MIVSSTMSEAYALNSFPIYVLGAIASILLIGFAIYADNRWGNYGIAGTASLVGAVALFSALLGGMILNRILLISGLFSWNSGNEIGWNVFYASVVAIAGFVLSILLIIIGSFMKSVK